MSEGMTNGDRERAIAAETAASAAAVDAEALVQRLLDQGYGVAGEPSGSALGKRSGSSDGVAPLKKRTRFEEEGSYGGETKNEGVSGGDGFIEVEIDNQGDNQEAEETKDLVENYEEGDESEGDGNSEETKDQVGNCEERERDSNNDDEAEANRLDLGSFLAPRALTGFIHPHRHDRGQDRLWRIGLRFMCTPPPTRYDLDQNEPDRENESEAEGVRSDESAGSVECVGVRLVPRDDHNHK